MRQLTTSDGKVITLNLEQNEALDKMITWYNSGGIYFRLSGFAGTGKTTITKWFIQYVKQNDGPLKICVIAPTHRAKRIIERATAIAGHTVARILGLAPDMDVSEFDPSKPEFTIKRESMLHEYDLVVLDEGSMTNKELFRFINKHIGTRTKLLILGDPAQLPPVKESLSLVFTSELIRAAAILSKVERTAEDNPLLTIVDTIRNDLTAPTGDNFPHITNLNERGEGIVFGSVAEIAPEMLERFLSAEYIDDPLYAKVLTWHNDRATWWNTHIRRRRMEMIHPSVPADRLFPIMQGDVMMAHNGYEGKIANGNDYLITRVEKTKFGCQYPNEKSASGHSTVEIDTYGVYFENTDTGATGYSHVLDQSSQANVDRYMKAHRAYIGKTKKGKVFWKEYFTFRSWMMLLQTIYPHWPDKKFAITKDLDYAYAITTHKSQGSEFQYTFVDAVDMNQNWKTEERNSMKYVALSRTQKVAYYIDK